jgi:hypothetical protein
VPNYPTSLDSLANPTPTTLRNDPGFSLAGQIATLNDIAEAIQAKLGVGAGGPGAAAGVLRRTATGASGWAQAQTADIATGAIATGQIGDAQVTTAKLAANATAMLAVASIPGQSVGAIPLSFMTGASFSLVTSGKMCLVGVTLVGYGSGAAVAGNTLAFHVDGASVANVANQVQPAGLYTDLTAVWTYTPAAGTRLFNMAWTNSAGTLSINNGWYWALELRNG